VNDVELLSCLERGDHGIFFSLMMNDRSGCGRLILGGYSCE
jgi:hypothetical protein